MGHYKELCAKIKAHTPTLYKFLYDTSNHWDGTTYNIAEWLEDNDEKYVIIDPSSECNFEDTSDIFHTLSMAALYNDYESAVKANNGKTENVFTYLGFIIYVYNGEKKLREGFSKWGYEFTLNDDNTLSIRKKNGRIAITVDVSNKITLI